MSLMQKSSTKIKKLIQRVFHKLLGKQNQYRNTLFRVNQRKLELRRKNLSSFSLQKIGVYINFTLPKLKSDSWKFFSTV